MSKTEKPESSRKSNAGKTKKQKSGKTEQVDRPGFDLGGSSGKTEAGKGLGLDTDAKEGKKGFKLPR